MAYELPVIIQRLIEQGDKLFAQYNDIGRPVLNFLHVIFNNLFEAFLILLGTIALIYALTTIYNHFRRQEPYQEMKLSDQDAPFVSVQIPTKNEIVALRCAEKCLAFDYPKDKYEIIIGDDSDQKPVSDAIASFAAQHPAVHVHKRESSVGYKAGNLNNMLRYSNGDFLVLFDSDFMPPADFLRRIVAPMAHDESVAAVQARWTFSNAEQSLTSILAASIGGVFHHVALPFFNKRRSLSVLCGSAEAVRKSILIAQGGWVNGSLTEDIEYSLRMLKNGYHIQYLPKLECASELPFKPRDLYKQQMRWAYGVISAFQIHLKGLLFSKKLNVEDKLLISYIFSGYVFSIALAAVVIFGMLSIITHEPAPIDISKFLFETGRNVLFTSGLLITGAYGLAKLGYPRKIGHMILSSFSCGLVVTYYVNVGIFSVLRGKPMPWYLLNKNGNNQPK